jgi:hypothetical protein
MDSALCLIALTPVELLLNRTIFSPQATIGELFIDSNFFCHVLEDPVRGADTLAWGQSAIPVGCYELTITYSRRFRQPLPLLVHVPGFESVRICPNNQIAHDEGCLLVGQYSAHTPDWVANSQSTFASLFARLQPAQQAGQHLQLTVR